MGRRDPEAALRSLVLRASRQPWTERGELPRLLWVRGVRPQVGATTVAVAIAETLAWAGYRVVLINGSPAEEAFCGLTRTQPVQTEWLAERREIHEVMQLGFAGLQVVSGLGTAAEQEVSREQRQWLHRQLCTLRPHADLVLIEGGLLRPAWSAEWSQWAGEQLLVGLADDASLHALAEQLAAAPRMTPTAQIGCVLNRVASTAIAEQVWTELRLTAAAPPATHGVALGSLPQVASHDAARPTPSRWAFDSQWDQQLQQLTHELMEGTWNRSQIPRRRANKQ